MWPYVLWVDFSCVWNMYTGSQSPLAHTSLFKHPLSLSLTFSSLSCWCWSWWCTADAQSTCVKLNSLPRLPWVHLHMVSISVPTFLNPVPCHHLYLAYYHNLWTRLAFSTVSPLHSVFPIILPYASTDHVNFAKTYKESNSGSLGPPNPSRTFFF